MPVTEKPREFQIRNSNVYSLAAQVNRAGGVPLILPVAKDAYEDTLVLAERGLQADLLLISGGVSAGKYDIEAERVAQPPGFAYMAPPGQSNQYGHWDHHDGRDFWVFYGEYALMRDLLFNRGYRPLDRYEWEGYRYAQRSGQTYYGHDEAAGQAPKYGTQGTATQRSYEGSTYAKSGGFKDSKYASKSGGYKDSKYASPSMRDPNADHSGRTFGKGSSREPEHNYRPPPSRPAPSYHPPARSPGRSFGRRR